MKSQVHYSKSQFGLLLIHLACQMSKNLFRESIPSVYVRTSLSQQTKHYKQLAAKQIGHESQSNKMNRLPLIFRCLHSQDSQLHNKCSFCSTKIIFISKIPPFGWRVMFRNPQAQAVTTGQKKIPNSIREVRRNMSNVFYNQSSGCFYNI